METQSPQDLRAPYWYGTPGEPGVIKYWFYGVFAGGGAKGVAYSGALLAMKEKECWFRGVAGASAGAITAALVASGLSPEEMENATDNALKQVRTGFWAGFRRLRNATGYFPSDGLRTWLDDLLRTQIARKTGAMSDANVTFDQLYDATGIELNVVAADLSLRRQFIFSHHETPACVIADAVVASSSIPFAFPSRLLQVPEDSHGRKQLYYHTVVDGGVWSNFPMFIFEDRAFREEYERKPEEIDPRQVLGFLLKEEGEREPPSGEDIKFVEKLPVGQIVREWVQDRQTVVEESFGFWSKVGTWMLYPFALLGRVLERFGGIDEVGRWPTPRPRWARNLVEGVNGMLGANLPLFYGLWLWATVAFIVLELFLLHPVGSSPRAQLTDGWSLLLVYMLLTVLAVLVALALFANLLVITANSLLLRTARRILFGLVTTYVAGPGAPEWWVAKKTNIIALTVPPSVTTLSFEIKPKDRQTLIAAAKQTTLAKLTEILSDRNRAA